MRGKGGGAFRQGEGRGCGKRSGKAPVRRPAFEPQPFAESDKVCVAQFVEKVIGVDVQSAAELKESAQTDAVGAAFVFLDLLKGYADLPAEAGLADFQLFAARANQRADVNVYRRDSGSEFGGKEDSPVVLRCCGCHGLVLLTGLILFPPHKGGRRSMLCEESCNQVKTTRPQPRRAADSHSRLPKVRQLCMVSIIGRQSLSMTSLGCFLKGESSHSPETGLTASFSHYLGKF